MKKKATEAESSSRLLKQKNKELLEAQKRKTLKNGPAGAKNSCNECKNKEKEKQNLLSKLNRAEKEALEVKNEKMEAILEQRNIEDRLRDREQDFGEREK